MLQKIDISILHYTQYKYVNKHIRWCEEVLIVKQAGQSRCPKQHTPRLQAVGKDTDG